MSPQLLTKELKGMGGQVLLCVSCYCPIYQPVLSEELTVAKYQDVPDPYVKVSYGPQVAPSQGSCCKVPFNSTVEQLYFNTKS